MVNHILAIDLSRSGIRLMTSEKLRIGELIAIDLPEVGQVMATVRWKEDVQYGLEFAEGLTKAELAATRLACQHSEPRAIVHASFHQPEESADHGPQWVDRLPSLRFLLFYAAFWGATVVALI